MFYRIHDFYFIKTYNNWWQCYIKASLLHKHIGLLYTLVSNNHDCRKRCHQRWWDLLGLLYSPHWRRTIQRQGRTEKIMNKLCPNLTHLCVIISDCMTVIVSACAGDGEQPRDDDHQPAADHWTGGRGRWGIDHGGGSTEWELPENGIRRLLRTGRLHSRWVSCGR